LMHRLSKEYSHSLSSKTVTDCCDAGTQHI